MIIGIPKEIKNHEYRVGLTPSSVMELVKHGHNILIQHDAGAGVDFSDDQYIAAGAEIVSTAEEIFARAENYDGYKELKQKINTNIAGGEAEFTKYGWNELIKNKCIDIAQPEVCGLGGITEYLKVLSEVAGRLSIQAGARCLEKTFGGLGILLGGSSYSKPAETLVIGGGVVVGYNASLIALGMGSDVTILEKSLSKIDFLKKEFPKIVFTFLNPGQCVTLINNIAVLIPGALAPKVITKKDLGIMKSDSVIVDVAIDQGGCFETSHATTHQDPTYIVDNIIHYCVANMPGAVIINEIGFSK